MNVLAIIIFLNRFSFFFLSLSLSRARSITSYTLFVGKGGKQVVGNDTRSLQHSPRAMQEKRLQEDKQDIAYARYILCCYDYYHVMS